MSGGETGVWALVAGVSLWGIVLYNRLVGARQQARAAWSDIDVQLKRRHDLLPKLAAVVRAYGDYESGVQQAITALRGGGPPAGADRAVAETRVTQAFRQLIAVVEAYPELQASAHYLSLQQDISTVEEQIQYARRYFNGSVRELNVLVEAFPSNLVARLTGFILMDYFEIELATQRDSPDLALHGDSA